MNLVIDQGNTRTKTGIFQEDNLLNTSKFVNFRIKDLQNIIKKYPNIRNAILSSVVENKPDIIRYLSEKTDIYIELKSSTLLPVKNCYKTKESLGKDRIAAVTGAYNIFPGENVMVIDFGTAITYEIINGKAEYLGGNISPGVSMRFRALNKFTRNLPLLTVKEKYELFASDTDNAIISGVLNGVFFEVESYIREIGKKFKELKIILTGGDCFLFDKRVKSTIFVDLNLVLKGLNTILNYNIRKQRTD